VIEEDVLAGEDSIELESEESAAELLAACVAELRVFRFAGLLCPIEQV